MSSSSGPKPRALATRPPLKVIQDRVHASAGRPPLPVLLQQHLAEVDIGIGQQHHQLFPAIAAYPAMIPQQLGAKAGHPLEHHVPVW
jgi:hypothetical protein